MRVSCGSGCVSLPIGVLPLHARRVVTPSPPKLRKGAPQAGIPHNSSGPISPDVPLRFFSLVWSLLPARSLSPGVLPQLISWHASKLSFDLHRFCTWSTAVKETNRRWYIMLWVTVALVRWGRVAARWRWRKWRSVRLQQDRTCRQQLVALHRLQEACASNWKLVRHPRRCTDVLAKTSLLTNVLMYLLTNALLGGHGAAALREKGDTRSPRLLLQRTCESPTQITTLRSLNSR